VAPPPWDDLAERLGARLRVVTSPLAPCLVDPSAAAAAQALRDLENPFAISDEPGGCHTTGRVHHGVGSDLR